jgi:hypothetical protein
MNRIASTTLHVARTDWAPYIEQAARAVATAAAFCYVAGYMTGRWLHNLNDRMAEWAAGRHHDAADLQAGTLALQQFRNSGEPSCSLEEVMAELDSPVLYRCAAVPARCGIQSPMTRAIGKVQGGMSQRKAASLCGVSRTSLQRALRG